MTKIEKLTEIAARLTKDQIEGLIHHAQSLLDQPFYDRAPPEVREDIKVGLEEIRAGRTGGRRIS